LKVKNKESKIQKKLSVRLNTPFDSLKNIVEESGLQLDHPLKGARIVPLVRKKT